MPTKTAKSRAAKAAPARKPAPKATAKKAAPARKPAAKSDPLARLREVCFSLPEVTEKEAWGEATFRVKEKMFAMVSNNHHNDGIVAVWCKAPLGMQELLIDADPERFYKPPYVGPNGWIGVRLDRKVDWEELHGLLAEAWRMTAPKKMLPLLDA